MPDPLRQPRHPVVRKARIGWWVDSGWCPTMKIRDHRVNKLWAGPSCNHEWIYAGTGEFTGYIEHCPKCDEIRQVVQ